MKKKSSLLVLSLTALMLASCGASQSDSSDSVITINIANSDDYILTYDTENGLPRTLVDDFVDYVKEVDGVTLKVNYSVFSTPEEILSK